MVARINKSFKEKLVNVIDDTVTVDAKDVTNESASKVYDLCNKYDFDVAMVSLELVAAAYIAEYAIKQSSPALKQECIESGVQLFTEQFHSYCKKLAE